MIRKKLWAIIERTFLKLFLRRLERAIDAGYDQETSRRIDAVRYLLDG